MAGSDYYGTFGLGKFGAAKFGYKVTDLILTPGAEAILVDTSISGVILNGEVYGVLIDEITTSDLTVKVEGKLINTKVLGMIINGNF
jgi:hypothetical protein